MSQDFCLVHFTFRELMLTVEVDHNLTDEEAIKTARELGEKFLRGKLHPNLFRWYASVWRPNMFRDHEVLDRIYDNIRVNKGFSYHGSYQY